MALPPHRTTATLPSHLRASSIGANASTTSSTTRSSTIGGGASSNPALAARVAEKRAELESLRELRDLSAQLSRQMEALEAKLGQLTDGTEAVAAVLANWHSVLQAISMASMKIPKPKEGDGSEETGAGADTGEENGIPLPQTLVRIPVQQMPEQDSSRSTGT